MADVALRYDPELFGADVAIEGGQLATDDGLATAIVISLFTDRRAGPDDELPPGETDRRGWWGDSFPPAGAPESDRIGSRLWLLARRKATEETRRLAEDFIREALQWLIDDGIASAVDLETSWLEPKGPTGRLDMRITIVRPNGAAERFQHVWEAV